MLCDVQEPVQAELKRDGLLELIGEALVFNDANDVLAAYKALPPQADPAPAAPATPRRTKARTTPVPPQKRSPTADV